MNNKNGKEYIKNPYPGIRSFELGEEHLFFGREKQTKELLNVLTKTHFIAITGASGSGKSSLIKAGLIPAVTKNDKEWKYIIFRPGNEPVRNISTSIFGMLKNVGFDKKDIGTIKRIENFLREEPNSIGDYLNSLKFNNKLLIYVDQFEEIFRFRQSEFNPNAKKDSEVFVDILIAAANQRKIPVYIIFTLRTDFLSDCTNFIGLPEMINNGHYLIPKMTLEEKEQAIKGPAKIGGAEISHDLMFLLSGEIKKLDVNLPVLQHALMRTWDYWLFNAEPGNPVCVEHYKSVGTVTDALSIHAEMIYDSFHEEKSKIITEKIFKALTHLGDDNRGIRRPTSLFEICKITGSRETDVIEVIEKFRAEGNSFLLPDRSVRLAPGSVIDISHESIMRVWKRLVDWVDEETKSAQTYLRLSKSAELYQEGKTGLLVNPDLQLALKWQEESVPNETWAKRYDPAFDRVMSYIEYSKKEYDKAIKAKEERHIRDLKRTRFIAFFLGSASLISILFLIVALNLRFKAENSEKEALEKEKLALKERKVAEEKKKEAISQGLIAEQQQQIAEQHRLLAEEQKQYAVEQQKEALYQKGVAVVERNKAVEAGERARKLQTEAERMKDSAIVQKNIAERERNRAEFSEAKTDTLRRIAIARSLAVQSVKLHVNNLKDKNLTDEVKKLPAILALQAYHFNQKYKGNLNDPDIFSSLLNVSESKTVIKGRNGHTQGIRDIAVSPGGNKFVTGSDDGTLRVYDLSNTDKSIILRAGTSKKDQIRSVAYSSDGNIIAGTTSGDIFLWSNDGEGTKSIVMHGHESVINHIIITKDNNSFYTASNEGTIRKWEMSGIDGGSSVVYESKTKITSVAQSIDGNFIAVALKNGKVKVFYSNNFNEVKEIQTKGGEILSMVWNADNDLNIGYQSGKIEVRKDGKIAKEIFGHSSRVSDMVYDAKANCLITCSYDGTVKVWNNVDFDIEPVTIKDHTAWIFSVALVPGRRTLISGSEDKNIRLTEIDIKKLKALVRNKVGKNMSKKNWLRYVGQDIKYSSELPE